MDIISYQHNLASVCKKTASIEAEKKETRQTLNKFLQSIFWFELIAKIKFWK